MNTSITRRCSLLALSLALGLGAVGATQAHAQERDGPVRQWLKERIEKRQAAKQQEQLGDTSVPRIEGPGDYDFALVHGGMLRRFKVYVPRSYVKDRAVPLMLAFHGGGGDMNYQANDTNYGQVTASERRGFVVVFPSGSSKFASGRFGTWNAGKCCAGARDNNVDDVGFVRLIIDELTGQLNIDRKKIYASGMSNGGMFSYRLACEMSDVFAGIASVAGTDNTISCAPKAPIPVLHIHARNDTHVQFGGGAGEGLRDKSQVTDFRSVPDTVARWVEFNGCRKTPERVFETAGAYCERYRGCREDVEVKLCVTDTGGHSWPGGTKTRGSEPTSKAISANDVMWEFFDRR